MVGWNLEKGECLNENATERELWSAINNLFYTSHKTTTYKFCVFKCLLDLLPDPVNNRLSFNQLFSRFTELYWELVANYRLKQAYETSQYGASRVETLINEFIFENDFTYKVPFWILVII